MATQQTSRDGKKTKTWRARVRVNGPEVYLGSFHTKKEAEMAENQFRENNKFDIEAGSVDSYLWD